MARTRLMERSRPLSLPIIARPRPFHQSRARHGAALLVSAALVLAARARPDLLADGADADVGLPATLRVAERRAVRAHQRRVHRRGAVVGYSIPRSARIFDFVPGGDVRCLLY